MDLDLSEDQELFRSVIRKFLDAEVPTSRVRELMEVPAGYDPSAWSKGAELGWFSMLVPEEIGGGSISGEGVPDLAIVAEELGRSLFPGPVLATNVVAAAIAKGGSSEQRAKWLPAIAGGETVASWALAEPSDRWGPSGMNTLAQPESGGYILDGMKTAVEYATAANLLLVSARTVDGFIQLLVPPSARGVTVVPLQGLDLTRRFAEVRFDGTRVPSAYVLGTPDRGRDDLERLLNLAIALQCAETVGAVNRTFEFTLAYAKDRKAFGRPIGSFQAIKHRFADMALWLESSNAAATAAIAAIQHEEQASEATSVAKSYIGQRSVEIVRDCLQIHGGIGFTWEHDIHLYLRRVESNRALYGSPEQHLDRVSELVGI